MRSFGWTGLVVIAAGVACFPGCDAGGGDDRGDDDTTRVEDYVAASCAYDERCLAELGKVYSSSTTCRETALAILACGLHQETPMFSATQRLEIDEARLPGCIAALEVAPCDGLRPVACDRVLRWEWHEPQGLADVGQSCQGGFCIVDAACTVSETAGVCAVCEAPRSSQLSEPCSDAQACDEGLACDSVSGKCVAVLANEAACSDGTQCRSGLCASGHCVAAIAPGRGGDCSVDGLCRANFVCLAGTCADRLGVGEVCAFDAQCAANAICRAGHCESIDVCQRAAPLGGPCVFGGCADGTYCHRQTHTCIALPVAGAACTSPINCPPSLRCNLQTMQCGPGKLDGQSCTAGFECANDACTLGVCSKPLACTMP